MIFNESVLISPEIFFFDFEHALTIFEDYSFYNLSVGNLHGLDVVDKRFFLYLSAPRIGLDFRGSKYNPPGANQNENTRPNTPHVTLNGEGAAFGVQIE